MYISLFVLVYKYTFGKSRYKMNQVVIVVVVRICFDTYASIRQCLHR